MTESGSRRASTKVTTKRQMWKLTMCKALSAYKITGEPTLLSLAGYAERRYGQASERAIK